MKKFLMLMTVLVMGLCMMVPAFAADDNVGSGIAVDTSEHSGSMYVASDPRDLLDLEDVSIGDVQEKLESKGDDVISILQLVGRYVCIGAFILGILFTIAGCFGNHKVLFGGLLTVILAGICYAAITCGPEIVHFIASWAAS